MRFSLHEGMAQVSLWFGRLEKSVLVILIAFLVGFSLLQVVLRNFFSTGLVWGDVLLRHVVLWAGMLGATRATAENRHIRIDILSRVLPERTLPVLRVASEFFPTIVSAALFYASWLFVQNERMAGDSSFAGVRTWWLELIFPISFAVMTIRFGTRLIESLLPGSRNDTLQG